MVLFDLILDATFFVITDVAVAVVNGSLALVDVVPVDDLIFDVVFVRL